MGVLKVESDGMYQCVVFVLPSTEEYETWLAEQEKKKSEKEEKVRGLIERVFKLHTLAFSWGRRV